MRTFLLMIITAFIYGCAQSPSSIPPVAVNSDEYSSLSCDQLEAQRNAVSARLEQAEGDQNSAQTVDAITVLFFLIPASALLGDAESDVAQYKGEKIALERAISGRC